MTGALPEGWEEVRMGEICDLNPKHGPETDRTLSVSFVPMNAVSETTGTIVSASIKTLDDVWSGYTHFREGDVLFAKITPCMENGKSAIARDLINGMGCGSTEFLVLRPHQIRPEYVHNYLRQPGYRRAAEAVMTGAVGQKRVPREFLAETQLPLPPIAEQRRIVEKIEALTARSGRAREALAALPSLLDRYRAAVLAAAFRGDLTADWREEHRDLGQIPEDDLLPVREGRAIRREAAEEKVEQYQPVNLPSSWRTARVGRIARLQPGYAFRSASFKKEGVRLLRGTNIIPGGTRWDDIVHLDNEEASHFEDYRLRLGDIVLAMDRPVVSSGLKIARLAQSDLPALLLQRVGRFQVSAAVEPDFLWHFLHTKAFVDQVMAQATGSDLPHVSANDVETTHLPLPPRSEQQEITRRIEIALRRIAHLPETEELEARLSTLDSAILTKAFRGELVPQDPTDEPASVLLERIRAERSAAGAKPRRARRAPEAAE